MKATFDELVQALERYEASATFWNDAWDAASATRPATLEEHVAAWWRNQPGYRAVIDDIAAGDREM